MLSPSQRSVRATIGAHVMHARNDGHAVTAAARAASRSSLDRRLLNEIDPGGALSNEERERRLKHARSAHFTRLAYLRLKRASA